MLAVQFGDLTTGIKDRSVFDVPSYCQKAAISNAGFLSQLVKYNGWMTPF